MSEALDLIHFLESFLVESRQKIAQGFLQEVFDKYFKDEFKDLKVDTFPKIRIKQLKGFGRFVFRRNRSTGKPDPDTFEFWINSDVFSDNSFVRRVIFHESIHWIETLLTGEAEGDGHGAFF